MPSLVTYDPSKEQPRPRTGSRGFSTTIGAVMFDPNVPTPVADELLTELEQIPDFKMLKDSGGIKIEPQAPPPEIVESQPADRLFNLPVPETQLKEQSITPETQKTQKQQQAKA